jgi:hypothetical protein
MNLGPGSYESDFGTQRLRLKSIIQNSKSPEGKGFGT